MELVLKFAFTVDIFIFLFIIVGSLMFAVSFFAWVTNRFTTHLINPPDFFPDRIPSYLALTTPPPVVGVVLAIIPIWIYLQIGNLFIYGVFYYDPNLQNTAPLGTSIMEIANNGSRFNLVYGNLLINVLNPEMVLARSGRMGTIFCIVGFACLFAGNRLYFPKKETKKELEIAKTLTKLAKRRYLWKPIFWRMQNFLFSSLLCAFLCILIVEFSYSKKFTDYEFQARILLYVFGKILDVIIRYQLQDHMLCMPISNAIGFTSYLVIFNSPTFIDFLLASFFLFGLSILNRIYIDSILSFIMTILRYIMKFSIAFTIKRTPKYLKGAVKSVLLGPEKEEGVKRKLDGKIIILFFLFC